jgi:hypothetical protein
MLKAHGVSIKHKRAWPLVDREFVERLWKRVKYEDIDLRAYAAPAALRTGLARDANFYNRLAFSRGAEPMHPGCGVLQRCRARGGVKCRGDFT